MDSREAMAFAHLSHLTSQAAYYKLDDCYSPLDIGSQFPSASPHTTVSFSSSSSRHDSPEGDEPSCSDFSSTSTKWPSMQSAPPTIAIPLYTSTSSTAESPASSLRSDPDDTQPDESTQSRRKGRKQFKPLRCESDREVVTEQGFSEVTSGDGQRLPSDQIMNCDRQEGLEIEELEENRSGNGGHSPTSSQMLENPPARFFPVGPSGARIFNPDAYCKLCDREFCNKYFLKTHMANKHAVYDPNHTPDQSRNDSNPEFADFKRSQRDSPSSINVPTIHIPDSGSHSDLDAIFASKMRLEQTSSAGEKRGKKEKRDVSPSVQRPVTLAQQTEASMEQVLRQQLMQMCAQNMALQQMFNSGMPPFFPGMMPGLIPGMPGFFPPQALPEPMLRPWPKEHEAHPESKTPQTEEREETLQCEICHKKLSSLNFLRNHLRKKHGVTENRVVRPKSPSPIPVRTEMLTIEELKRSKKQKRDQRRQERKENERKSRERMEAEAVKQENETRRSPPMAGFSGMVDARMLRGLPVPFPFGSGAPSQPQFSNLQRLLQIPREVFRCRECPKEFTTAYFLEQHFRNEHSKPTAPPEPAVLDLSTPKSRDRQREHGSLAKKPKPKRETPSTIYPTFSFPSDEEAAMGVPATASDSNLDEFCVKCNRVYCSKYFLRTHLKKSHGMSTEEYLNEVSATHPDLYQQYRARDVNKEGDSPSRSNWCRYCKKDLCNKYFFKTHMIKTHQEHVAHFDASSRSSKKRSNGVQCDICQKNLCSKYFLRIHKRNAHGIGDPSLPNGSSPSFPTMSDLVHFGSEGSMGENEVRRSDSGEEEVEMEDDLHEQEPVKFTCRPVIVSCGATDFVQANSPAVDMGFSESPLSSESMKDHHEEDFIVKTEN